AAAAGRPRPARTDGRRGRDGFQVDPDALADYARRTRAVADELAALRAGGLRAVAKADESFGRIGRETGFAAALDRYGTALRHQVHGLGRNADTLASSVANTARTYRDQESAVTHDLLRLLGDK
ncbi:type VII secretion target, partial [Actinophytocola sediminis]